MAKKEYCTACSMELEKGFFKKPPIRLRGGVYCEECGEEERENQRSKRTNL